MFWICLKWRARHYKIYGSVFKSRIPCCEACSLTAQNSFCWRTWLLAMRFRVCWTWRWGHGSTATTRPRRKRPTRSASVSRAPRPWSECESAACRWGENSSAVANSLEPVSVIVKFWVYVAISQVVALELLCLVSFTEGSEDFGYHWSAGGGSTCRSNLQPTLCISECRLWTHK